MVSAFIDEKQDNWDKLLPMLTFAYNTAVHGTTKCTPFELIYGRKPKIPLDVICDEKKVNLQLTPEDYAENVSKVLEDIFKRVRENTGVKMDRAKIRHDRNVRAANFEISDLVWVLDSTKTVGKSKKFKKKWAGPYKIVGIINDVDYMIKPANRNGRTRVVHQNLLKRCFGSKFIATGCNDVQHLGEKKKRGRPRKNKSNPNVEAHKEVVVENQIPDSRLGEPQQTISNNLNEGNVLRKSTRTTRAPERYDSQLLLSNRSTK
jgi:hypothetical protein